jgi:hypothetical protein
VTWLAPTASSQACPHARGAPAPGDAWRPAAPARCGMIHVPTVDSLLAPRHAPAAPWPPPRWPPPQTARRAHALLSPGDRRRAEGARGSRRPARGARRGACSRWAHRLADHSDPRHSAGICWRAAHSACCGCASAPRALAARRVPGWRARLGGEACPGRVHGGDGRCRTRLIHPSHGASHDEKSGDCPADCPGT